MSLKIKLFKYEATGNSFILFDNRKRVFPLEKLIKNSLVGQLCTKENGFSTDGVILLEESQDFDFKMRTINADGTEVEMCGNGLRAICHYAYFEVKIPIDNCYRVETLNGVYNGFIEEGGSVKVQMTELFDIGKKDLGKFNKFSFGFYLNTGVPHCVFEVENLESFDIQRWGEIIRRDPLFPEGCNVNFYEKKGEALVNLRTFERGVEGETLSCGTGATATAIALSKRYGWENQVDVVMRGGDLTIEFTKEYKDVFLCGEVKKILSCSYEIK
ncbi:MAG: diaminopimelate epimerase [Bdellovibrionota bacterium]|nr:diaminopimelate epimerase [Bdellovibrionota bacterium]